MTPKEFVIRCLERELGNIEDDLRRAEIHFSRFSVEQMNQRYELAGKTGYQILADYREKKALAQQALEWVKGK